MGSSLEAACLLVRLSAFEELSKNTVSVKSLNQILLAIKNKDAEASNELLKLAVELEQAWTVVSLYVLNFVDTVVLYGRLGESAA